MARYFTSDLHLNETRIGDIRTGAFNPFYRPFASVEEQNRTIIEGINKLVGPDDRLYVLGDVSLDLEGISLLDEIACRDRVLILGNYDVDDPKKRPLLEQKFTSVHDRLVLNVADIPCLLQHYPKDAVPDLFNIVGHIHGLWKVQPNMINVGVDAWHFLPVSEAEIAFAHRAIKNAYDVNVFPLWKRG